MVASLILKPFYSFGFCDKRYPLESLPQGHLSLLSDETKPLIRRLYQGISLFFVTQSTTLLLIILLLKLLLLCFLHRLPSMWSFISSMCLGPSLLLRSVPSLGELLHPHGTKDPRATTMNHTAVPPTLFPELQACPVPMSPSQHRADVPFPPNHSSSSFPHLSEDSPPTQFCQPETRCHACHCSIPNPVHRQVLAILIPKHVPNHSISHHF